MKSVAADGFAPQQEAGRRLQAQGDFRTVYAKNFRIAARRTARGGYASAGQKTKFHEPPGELLGQVYAVDDAVLAAAEFP